MSAVSDTSPINYLIQIGEVHLLQAFFGTINIPTAVLEELSHPRSPEPVRHWLASSPAWLTVQMVSDEHLPSPTMGLQRGERQAIALAITSRTEHLLLDEAAARKHAGDLGLPVVGTLGILLRGARSGMVDLEAALLRLSRTNFRASGELLRRIRISL